MKTFFLIASTAFLILFFGPLARPADPPKSEFGGTGANKEVESLGTVLFMLAAERYALATNTGSVTVLSWHDWRKNAHLLKYSDGKYVVVSLPVMPDDVLGVSSYISHYNSFTEMSADHLVKAGKFKEARDLYSLVLRFGRPAEDLSKQTLEKKLSLLTKIETSEDSEKAKAEFAKLCDELAAPLDFTQIAKTPAVVVTNLMEVIIPP